MGSGAAADNKTQADTQKACTNKSAAVPGRGERQKVLLLEVCVFVGLALAALLPRISLAGQLDMVTDEVIYLRAGQIYLSLIPHFGSFAWQYNYEHPSFVKLLFGLAQTINASLGQHVSELLAGRIPSVLSGTLLVVAIYGLGKAPFGRLVALASALCLALSPWLVYFSALAYLDMTMTLLMSVAFLLLWHALRRPWLYPLCALLVGLGAASKYTAALIIPGMVLFVAYYFLALRPHLTPENRPTPPWRWWLIALIVTPLTFLAADPSIWYSPYQRLLHSISFEWDHSLNGHLTFINGQDILHVPQWAIFYITSAKISAFVTLPASFFLISSLVRQIRFHMQRNSAPITQTSGNALLLIWLLSLLGTFNFLNIMVGTHYYLPLAPPVVLAGGCGLAALTRYRRGFTLPPTLHKIFVVVLLITTLSTPHLIGLLTVPAAEGYTSEFFQGENQTLQVAYPAYREAVEWLGEHTRGKARVGLVALQETLTGDGAGLTWFRANTDLPARLSLVEVVPGTTYNQDYLIWPMHLEQRGFSPPPPWKSHIIHIVSGGKTTYCFILARADRPDII